MPDLESAGRDLKDLARQAQHPGNLDDIMTRALESLHGLIPHDLAAVLGIDGPDLKVLAARGPLADEAIRSHRISLRDHPSILRALNTRRPLVLDEDHHAHGEGDPYDGVLDLPTDHSCMVVPLYTPDRPLGLITFDRLVCGTYDAQTIALADAYGQVLSLALLFAEQSEELRRYRERIDERERVLVQETGDGGEAGARLERSRSSGMRRLVEQARQVARTDAPVLILGETGTGKEVLARALHGWSARADAPFLTLNCAAIPETLIESELFGHVKGAFSGADTARPGRFLAADGGTLLLDEIGDMPAAAQAKLLRVLQEGSFEPVGSDVPVSVDVRILAATHRDLQAAVAAGDFREDLFYRLDVFPLTVPPLRERAEDMDVLAEDVLAGLARRTGRGPWELDAAARRVLAARDWPGNVRQLVNVLERATILSPVGVLTAADLGDPRAAAAPPRKSASSDRVETLAEVERRHLAEVLRRTGGKIYGEDGAAVLLGLKPTTLQSRLRKLGIDRRRPGRGSNEERGAGGR